MPFDWIWSILWHLTSGYSMSYWNFPSSERKQNLKRIIFILNGCPFFHFDVLRYTFECAQITMQENGWSGQKQKVRVDYLAMKIQLSPVTISPSMYIPLPLPHMPTKITKITSNDLLPAAQTCSPPLTLSILSTFSPFWEISPCHKIVSLRLFPKFRSSLLNALRIECSV